MMNAKQKRDTERLAKMVRRAAEMADKLDAKLGNGGEIGGILGCIAAELEVALEANSAPSFAPTDKDCR